MISVSNVSMRFGAKVLFDEVSTGFTPGKRYGLTGPNGAGKSTFMKLLTGEIDRGTPLVDVVENVLLSQPGQEALIQSTYQDILGRDADSGEMATALAQLKQGVRLRQIARNLLASDEFFSLATGGA